MTDKQMILGMQLGNGYGTQPGAWRAPGVGPSDYTSFDRLVGYAQAAERGKLHFLFLPDFQHLNVDVEREPPNGTLGPMLTLAAVARGTERIGLVATGSTTFTEPYNLARQFKALDVMSYGRAGWNAVTTSNPGTAANYGAQIAPQDERYERPRSDPGRPGSLGQLGAGRLVRDVGAGRFADASKIQPVDFQGRYVASLGPLPIPPSEQGQPVIFQAGGSPHGLVLAGRYASGVIGATYTIKGATAQRAAIREAAERSGRNPDEVKFFAGVLPATAPTKREALDKRTALGGRGSPAGSGIWGRCWASRICAELTCRRGGFVCWRHGREELFGGAVFDWCWWQVDVVFFEDGADLEEGGADGAVADAEQLGQDSAGGDFAVEKDGGEDTFPAGDLLGEDAAAGSGETLATALLVATSFHRGCLADRHLLDECGEIAAAHTGQRGVGQFPGHRRAAVVVLSGTSVVGDLIGAGEPQRCRFDGDVLFVQEMPDVGDRLADRRRDDFQHVRQEALGADLAQVDDGDQDPVAGREQGFAVSAGGVAPWTAASLVAALFPAGGLLRGEPCCECVQLGGAHAGQTRVGEHRQGRGSVRAGRCVNRGG
ncbi:LLM class flavin-dependent oxidoreductase [Frankia sp. Cpl3]|nr:LLM class flavin-dependent oxidoreductase [Frankia sp. Cpl3]